MTRLSLGGSAGKKYQKRLNTRGKRFLQRSTTARWRQDRRPIGVVGLERLRRRSFSLLGDYQKLFTSYSHPLPLSPCQRLEIRNQRAHRQEKISNLFSSHIKKILTENSESTLPKNYKPLLSGEADSERFRELTE